MNAEVQPPVTITGNRVALGPLRSDLLETFVRWGNDWATYRMVDNLGVGTEESSRAWLQRESAAENVYSFLIYERATWRPIGTSELRRVDLRDRIADFAIMIAEEDCRGRGYGTEVTLLTLNYGFTTLGLNNIQLQVFEFNPAAIHIYRKVGFREIGRRRQAHWMGGRFWDVIYMDLLAEEFVHTAGGNLTP